MDGAKGWPALLEGRAQVEGMLGQLRDRVLGGGLGERPGLVGRMGRTI